MVSRVTDAHRGIVLRAKSPPQKRTKRGASKTVNGTAKREQTTNTDIPAETQKYKHNLTQEKYENKKKKRRQNAKCRIYMTITPRHEKTKETAPQNAQKQQNNTPEPKARNKAAKTASLFRIAKII